MTSIPVSILLCGRIAPESDALSDIEALRMVDEAYNDRTEWIKKSIRTTAKVWIFYKRYNKGRL